MENFKAVFLAYKIRGQLLDSVLTWSFSDSHQEGGPGVNLPGGLGSGTRQDIVASPWWHGS